MNSYDNLRTRIDLMNVMVKEAEDELKNELKKRFKVISSNYMEDHFRYTRNLLRLRNDLVLKYNKSMFITLDIPRREEYSDEDDSEAIEISDEGVDHGW